MKRKIFLASGFGAWIGTLVALSVNQIFWWVGMIVGGVIGYLSYEFKEVLRAIKIAIIRFRPDWKSWKLLIKHFFWVWIFSLNFVLILLAFVVFSEERLEASVILDRMSTILALTTFMFVFSISEIKIKRKDIAAITESIEIFRSFTPFHVYLIYIPKIFYFLCREGIPKIFYFFYRKGIPVSVTFIKEVIILIHSDIRLLCGFDAGFGTAVGYYIGNPIIGMLAGGLIGILNYELISKKVLHLIPKK